MFQLQTQVSLPATPQPRLAYGDDVLSMGSCFSEHIGAFLTRRGHSIVTNPFGALYNPLSIAQALSRLAVQRPFELSELFEYDGLWHSPMHHGSFSAADPEVALERINAAYMTAASRLPRLRYLLLTWGTAYVYRERTTGQIVANCHKRPERAFERQRLSMTDLANALRPLLAQLLEQLPDLQIITTVSPIRHLRDGSHAGQLSKATLLLMDEALRCDLGARYLYFPAYEIVMDELRDYRFYADDLTHPSDLTVRIIRDRFADWACSAEANALGRQVEKLYAQWTHRPLHPDHPEYDLRRGQLEMLIRSLVASRPDLDIRSWFPY